METNESARRRGWAGTLASWLLIAAAALPGLATAGDPRVDAAWETFLREAEADPVYALYTEALKVEDDGMRVDKARCREHATALEDAVKGVPVGLAIHYNAYRCAQALGDDDAAERHLEWFSALARHALASAPEDWTSPPIRVVVGRDIYALLDASGLEFRYQTLVSRPLRRYLIVEVAAWDPEAKLERHLQFDFTDTFVQLSRQDEMAPYPAFRKSYQDNVTRHFAQQRQIMGLDLDAVDRASRSDDPAERVTLLRPIAEQGGMSAAYAWLLACREKPFAGCGEGLVDALLPEAEKQHGVPTLLLALAHAYGVGVDKDERAGRVLLDAADRIMGPGRGSVEYARYVLGMGEAFSPALEKRLARAAREGVPSASVLLAIESQGKEGKPWSAADLAAVRAAADAGSAAAISAMAFQQFTHADDAEAVLWLSKAATIGDAGAQELYARYLAEGRGIPRDEQGSDEWNRRAAAGGDTDAMIQLGFDAWNRGQGREAELWLVSGAMYGSDEALFEVADLFTRGMEGVRGDVARGVELLEEFDKDHDSAAARRRLAELYLAGTGVDKDPEKARAYYLQDAMKDDRESQTVLGLSMMDGLFGEPEREAGEAWVMKAVDAGHVPAIDGLASHYFFTIGGAASRARALALWRDAEDAEDNIWVLNNLSWVLCTSPHEDTYGPEEGARLADKLDAEPSINASQIDTVAACLAAGGRFEQAVKRQEAAIAKLVRFDPDQETLEGMRARLALYRANKAYRDAPES